MKNLLIILLTLFITGCGDEVVVIGQVENNIKIPISIATTSSTVEGKSEDSINNQDEYAFNEYETYFVLIADTSKDYYYLRKKMIEIRDKLNLTVDTMGRYYNPNNDLIMLPDDDDDEIYAGDYFPRRFPSDNLSLEYLVLYQKDAGEKTIALVRGIYGNENNVNAALKVIKILEPNSFYVKAEMYVGCMH